MKKVFISSHGLASVGIDIFVANIAKAFDKSKWDVSLVLALDEDGQKQSREDEVRSAAIPILYTCDLGSIKRLLIHLMRLYRLLKANSVDVYHSNMGLLDGLNCLMAWAAGVPVRVSHSHTTGSHFAAKTGRQFVSGVFRFLMKNLCALTANRKCGCSSPAMAYMYGKNWQTQPNTYIINNGIDTSLFSQAGKGRDPYHKKIISVARLCKEKNPFFAVDVIGQLSQIRQDFTYYWAGSGELEEAVKRTVTERGLEQFIQFLGVRTDIEAILPGCDLFLMPSLFEGLGIALIEAQAAGLPCVASNAIPPEADCGGCLFLHLDASPKEWAMRISDILDGKQTLPVDQEKLQKFDISYTIRQLEEVYSGN